MVYGCAVTLTCVPDASFPNGLHYSAGRIFQAHGLFGNSSVCPLYFDFFVGRANFLFCCFGWTRENSVRDQCVLTVFSFCLSARRPIHCPGCQRPDPLQELLRRLQGESRLCPCKVCVGVLIKHETPSRISMWYDHGDVEGVYSIPL